MTKPILIIENLKKQYTEQIIFEGINLEVDQGETVVIIGPSGTGKSTLLRCINLLTRPNDGKIFLSGQEITNEQVDENEVRQKIGMVFQNFLLFNHLTALENVTLGLRKVLHLPSALARKKAIEHLERVGLGDHIQKYPGQLSGGQQQRVGIARALAMEPQIMLFDEPTSALDPELIGEVLEVIRYLAQSGMTMLIVTHEMAFAREVADRIVFMEGGRVVEEGKAERLFESPISDRTREFLSSFSGLKQSIRKDQR